MAGWTMCSWVASVQWARHRARMAAAVSFPSSDGMGRTLCPVDSMAPVSWTLMCPVWAAMTPWWGRRAAAITVVLTWVPPTKKWTDRSSPPPHKARTWARALSQNVSSPYPMV